MQPYFLPYIGYFQLINAVDEIVIYDNIEYTKKGWVNRNRILVNGIENLFSLPLKKDSDYMYVNQRFLADTWKIERKKILNRINESYRKALHFEESYQLIEKCINHQDLNLFNFVFNSLEIVLKHLNINTKIVISSSIQIDHQLKSYEKVIAICKERGAEKYFNPIGGLAIYDKELFKRNNLELKFLKSNYYPYSQFNYQFVPWLSILDVLMFNSVEEVNNMLNQFELV